MKTVNLYLFVFVLVFIHSVAKGEFKTIKDGNTNANIKIIVFESLTCSHCAEFHKKVFPELKKNFIDTGLVEIEFKNFPLDKAALNASMLAHCKNDGQSEILHHLYKNQNKWVKGNTIEELNDHLKKVTSNFNIDYDDCVSNTSLEDHILEDRIEGVKKYKINATPTLIINGKKFDKPINYKNLKKNFRKNDII